MKILFIGDIVGKIGRKAVAEILPRWREEHKPDFVIANGENMAHGSGFTPETFEEVRKAGVDFFTSGNHWARKEEGLVLFSDKRTPIIRPANWVGSVPGQGFRVVEVGATPVAIVNLMGQVFIHENMDSPFHALDAVLEALPKTVRIIFVDFHAEATSESTAFGHYADGRVSAVVGTHTHVPTADARVLPGGTAYVTDVGMSGALDSVIGDAKEDRIAQFLDQMPHRYDIPEAGAAVANAVLVEIDPKTGKAESIARLDAVADIA